MIDTTCYIINYNAKDFLIPCLESVINAVKEIKNIEICVVDNASIDGSVEAVQTKFGDNVRVISNKENLGGAGGFNTALRDSIKYKREFAILFDNDILVDDLCVKNMLVYLKSHNYVGAVGAKIMMMDKPDFIQEFGGHLDFDDYYFKTDYWYERDCGTEDEIESEWLSSCAFAVRLEAVQKTKLFPEDNFLFWDDIQFTWEIRRCGYKLISLSNSKVWHKGKKKVVTNTSSAYYAMRNRIRFFSRAIQDGIEKDFCKKILEVFFDIFFGSTLKGLDKVNASRMFALDDFVNKKFGKIRADALFQIDGEQDKIADVCRECGKVFIKNYDINSKSYRLVLENLKERLSSIENVILIENEKKADVIFVPCEHIFEVKHNILPEIWVDKYLNCIATDDDFNRVMAMPYIKEMFVKLHYDWLMKGIIAERERL